MFLTKCDEIVHYIDGKLYIDEVNCEELIKKYDGPMLIYSENRIVDNIVALKKAFLNRYPNCGFFFAYKACYFPKILNIIKENGFGAEVSSSYEFAMAKKNKVGNSIMWNSPGKSEQELNYLINNKIYWNVDSLEETILINELAKKNNTCINIGMRINPDVKIKSSYIERGGKLGIDVESGQALEFCEQLQNLSNVRLIGLHSHLSVENTNPWNHVLSAKALKDFAKMLQQKFDIKLEYLSLGGGFAARNHIEEAGYSIDDFAIEICPLLYELDYRPKLILEPGRYVVDDAAICIGKILCKKKCWDNSWWITDMGTNLLPSFYGRDYNIVPVIKNNRDKICVNIGDRTSSFSGVIKEKILIQDQDANDFIAALNCGSYTFSCAQNYFYPISYHFYIVSNDKLQVLYKYKSEEQYIKELYEQSYDN